MSNTVKVLIGCGVLTLLSVLCIGCFFVLGIGGIFKAAEEINEEVEEQEDAEQEAFDNPEEMGKTLTIDSVDWTLVEVKKLGSTLESKYGEFGEDCVADNGEYIQVKVTVKNNTDSSISISGFSLYDGDKREFSSSTDVYGCTEEDLSTWDSINPGLEKSYVSIYEVPKDSSDFRIRVGNWDLFDTAYKYISLGF